MAIFFPKTVKIFCNLVRNVKLVKNNDKTNNIYVRNSSFRHYICKRLSLIKMSSKRYVLLKNNMKILS